MGQKSNGIRLKIIRLIKDPFSKIRNKIVDLLLNLLVILVVLHILLLIIMGFAFLAIQSGNYGNAAPLNFPVDIDLEALSLIKFIIILLAGILIVSIFRDESRTVIIPFENQINNKNYSGKAISDLLIANLVQISRIQDVEYDEMIIKRSTNLYGKIGKERLSPTLLGPEYLTDISELGSVVLGPTSFSVGQLLRILKQICPGNDPGIISGSLQKHGSVISLVAIMEKKSNKAWEVRRSIKFHNENIYEYISSMITELAFKIHFDQSVKDISAKSWLGLKYYTEALDSYQQYKLIKDIKILEISQNKCIRAVSVNADYKKPIILLYNIGIEYWKKNKYYEAEKLFRQIVILEPDNVEALEAWGIALRFFLLDEAAIKCLEKALDKNPTPDIAAEIYCMKSISYRNLPDYEKSIECLNESQNLKKNYGFAYQQLGQIYLLKGNKDKAIEAFENCEKYDKNLTLIHPTLAHIYKNKSYLFSWNEIPGNDNVRLIEVLKQNFYIDWVTTAKIEKIDDDKIIKVSTQKNHLSLKINDEQNEVSLEIDDGRTEKFVGKFENSKLNIYNKSNYEKFEDHCRKAEQSLEGRTEYNRACYETICGDKKKALELFDIVFNDKQVNKKWIQADPDLEFIRDDPDFKKKLDEYDTKEDDPGILLSKAAIYRKLDIENKYLFSWEKIPGNDNVRLIEFLMQKFSIEWIKAAKINKNDNGKTIRVTNDTNFLSLTLNNKKTNVDLEIDDGTTDKFIVKTENGELDIYENKYKMFMNIRSLLKDENREYDCARYYAICRDNREKALELLRVAIIKKQKSPEIALYDPDFEFISDDPRFQMLLEEFIEGQEIHSNTETIQLY